ncbi:MAG: hypothetical protein CME70_06600 [Halobacteriovorax sp.]|nr:hypothetical protein [Halobacteriovorax sp.]|tara:strand:+ start:532249 stop:534471 length:2223 start_codon:yes stop_codon:yes gene_type:complete
MNSKTVKIFSIFILLTVIFAVGAGFYVQKKLNPEALKTEIYNYVSNNYPNLELEISQIEIGLGLTSDIGLKEVKLKNKGEAIPSELLTLNHCEIKVPLLNILTGGGTLKIFFKSPTLNYISKNKSTNWLEGLKKKINTGVAENKGGGEVEQKSFPSLLANSQINAQFLNLKIKHQENEKNNTYEFDKFQLNDVGIKRPTAFNLVSKININNKESIVEFNLKSVGELNLKAFLEDKVIQLKAQSRIGNLHLNKRKILNEELISDSKLSIRKNNTGVIETELKISEVLEGKFKVLILKDKLEVKTEDFKAKLEWLMKVAELKIEGLGYSESWLKVKGSLNSGKDNKLTPNFSVNLVKPMSYDYKGNFIGVERVKLSLVETDFKLETSMNAFKGRIDLRAGNTIDINEPLDLKKLDIFEASLILNGLEIDKSLVPNEEKKSNTKADSAKPYILPIKLSVELKNILLFDEAISGSGEVLAVKKMLALKQFKLNHKKGILLVDTTTRNLESTPEHSFNIEAKDFDATLMNGFLEKNTPRFTGKVNASIVGKVKTVKEKPFYDAFIKGNVVNGELKGYDLSSMVNGYIERINSFPYFSKKPLKPVKISQNFEVFSFDIHAKSDKTSIKKSKFIGVDKKIEIRSQGNLRPKGNSDLYLNIFDKKKKVLKFLKEVDMKQFPVKLSGPGYELKPDYNYTFKFVKKKATKRLKKKAKAEAKKVIKKEIKKLEEKVLKGKKAKDLLKDIFK